MSGFEDFGKSFLGQILTHESSAEPRKVLHFVSFSLLADVFYTVESLIETHELFNHDDLRVEILRCGDKWTATLSILA